MQVLYCGALIAALQQLGPWLQANQRGLSLFGAVMMLLFAWCLVWNRRHAAVARQAPTGSAAGAYSSAIGLGLVNPMTLMLLMGAMASIFGAVPPSGGDAGLLLLGQFTASFGWWLCVCGAITVLRRQLSQGLLLRLNHATAAALVGFGVIGLVRVAGIWH